MASRQRIAKHAVRSIPLLLRTPTATPGNTRALDALAVGAYARLPLGKFEML
jgi:hypothetical protein